MSHGTLRALGILLAVFQAASARPGRLPPLLIGLEEPEMALHPAAASILVLFALREGARYCQILVTSHSPDLLDNADIPAEELLAVDNHHGLTRIGPIDQPGREALRNRLFTPGELLRQESTRTRSERDQRCQNSATAQAVRSSWALIIVRYLAPIVEGKGEVGR